MKNRILKLSKAYQNCVQYIKSSTVKYRILKLSTEY